MYLMGLPFPTIEALVAQLTSLAETSPHLDRAALVMKLKKAAPQADAQSLALALDTYIARRDATEKLGPWSTQGFFSLPLVEQASRTEIATYRASYFAGVSHVLEIGTGTGSDTAALARICSHVTTIEIDPVRAELARRNISVQGIENVTFLTGDIASLSDAVDVSTFDGFFADPARRTTDGQRVKDAELYSPPLSELLTLTQARVRAIKVSPGLFFDAPKHGWSRQFVGYGSECLEQTLWYGAPVIDSSVYRVDTRSGWSSQAAHITPSPAPTVLSGFVCEAHACVNRSQHLATFFQERGIAQIAPDVAYGISPIQPAQDPLLVCFEIIDAFPFSPHKLREVVTSLGWTNRTEIKKRNIQIDPEEVRSLLKLQPHYHDAPFGTILLFTRHDTQWAIVARRRTGD
jgi:SAM-dependent methyltransferase